MRQLLHFSILQIFPQQQERVATSALKSPTAAPVDGSESYANGADPLAFASEVFVFAALVSCVASETAVKRIFCS